MPERSRNCLLIRMALILTLLFAVSAPAPEVFAQERAPGISLRDINGRIFSLRDYEKKTVLIIFSTTWCATCRTEIPHFKTIYHTYGPRGLVMANIDIQEGRDKVARYAAKYQLPYRVLLDETGSVAAAYGIMGVPAMVLIKNGVIVTRHYRQVDGVLERLFMK